MFFVTAGQANSVYLDVVNRTTGAPIITGTITFYLKAETGTNAGHWYKASDATWSDTEVSAGAGVFQFGSSWSCSIAETAWTAGDQYRVYCTELAAVWKPYSEQVICSGFAASVLSYGIGVTSICNYALALIGRVGQGNVDYLETIDGDPADPDALSAMAWAQRLYPIARDYAQIKLQPPECLVYKDPGSALAAASAATVPGWDYCFTRPNDCLLFLGVVNDAYVNEVSGTDVSDYPYLELGAQIAMNVDDDVLFKYIKRLDDTTKFSHGLMMVIAHRLSYLMARPMGLDGMNRAELLKEFGYALNDAMGQRGYRKYLPKPERTQADAHYGRRSTRQVYEDASGLMHHV